MADREMDDEVEWQKCNRSVQDHQHKYLAALGDSASLYRCSFSPASGPIPATAPFGVILVNSDANIDLRDPVLFCQNIEGTY